MKVFKSPLNFQRYCCDLSKNNSIGFIPTMGALHEGHLSLVKNSKTKCHKTIVSIFVNPLQFGPKEDLRKYPRPLQEDLKKLKQLCVDAVFTPNTTNYTHNSIFHIEKNALSENFCGAYRPGHFRGVTTIVLKLINSSQCDFIFMGLKDYQQFLIIKRMISDLNLKTKIIGGATIRDKTGLALSSRNQYLSITEKEQASHIYSCLKFIKKEGKFINSTYPIKKVKALESKLKKSLNKINNFRLQYANIVDADTLTPPTGNTKKLIALVAGHFSKTRLIDNILI